MSFYSRFKGAVYRQGVKGTVLKIVGVIADYWFDWRYGTETCSPEGLSSFTIAGENRKRATFYQATRVMPLRKLFPVIKSMLPGPCAFVDLGCGKGRVLLVAAEAGFPKVTGVEFARELCTIARSNWSQFQTKARMQDVNCEIVESDVSVYRIRDNEAVFFIFNPFDETILDRVLGNIAASVKLSPRRALVIFFQPKECYRQIIAKRKEFEFVEERLVWGNSFCIYASGS